MDPETVSRVADWLLEQDDGVWSQVFSAALCRRAGVDLHRGGVPPNLNWDWEIEAAYPKQTALDAIIPIYCNRSTAEPEEVDVCYKLLAAYKKLGLEICW